MVFNSRDPVALVENTHTVYHAGAQSKGIIIYFTFEGKNYFLFYLFFYCIKYLKKYIERERETFLCVYFHKTYLVQP